MNNKVKFLRGTSGEYAVAEKDNDTIYFTTDDGKLYIGDKEVSGSGSYTLPIATTEILGGVMPDGTTITVDENGVISGSTAGAKLLVSGTGTSFTFTGSYNAFYVYLTSYRYNDSSRTIHSGTISKGAFLFKEGWSSLSHTVLADTAGKESISVGVKDNIITVSKSATIYVYGF